MIYLKIINAAMKTKVQITRVFFWIILGIAVLLTNLALNIISPTIQEGTATTPTQTDTIATPAGAQEEAGSTDGLMIMAVLIVLIVIIPILLKRRAWENGKKNRPAPPS
jgi:hypothetical protein